MTFSKTTTNLKPIEQKLWALFDFTVTDLGFRIVRVDFYQGTLQLMIEPLECTSANRVSVNVDDCAKVSRAVAALMDVEDVIADKYTLEVSSTGIERPLVTVEDFADYAGNRVMVKLITPQNGGKKHLGIVNNTENTTLNITSDDGEALAFELNNIATAYLAPTQAEYQAMMQVVK